MLVMVCEEFACIRIIGHANFTSSVDFKALVAELRQRGSHRFVLELSECVLMDSTFLGVLAGLGLKLGAGGKNQTGGAIELLNPTPRVTDLLETLGVLHLFKVTRGSLESLASAQAHEAASAKPSKAEIAQACLEAHQTLIEINPANAARFKDVAQFLAEGLKKGDVP